MTPLCFRFALPLGIIFIIIIIIGQTHGMLPLLSAAFGVLSMTGMALIWRDISSKVKGNDRTIGSLLSQYFAVKVIGWLGQWQRKKLEVDTLNVKQVQEEILLRRLSQNADTRHGKRYDFGSIKDSDTFRARHPVTTYEHDPQTLAMTSGTWAPSTMLLTTSDTNTEFFLQGVCVCLDVMLSAFPTTDSLQRTAKFFYSPALRQSEVGIPIGPNSSRPASSRHMLNLCTTPTLAFQAPSERDVLYLHLLFALKDPSVGTLESNFASTVFHAFSTLQERWQELVEDVEAGKVSSSLALEPELRAGLESLLGPDPGRAAQLRALFRQGFGGIASRLWPRLRLVLAVDSGSNQIYGEMLREHFCRGVDFYSPFYAATEGLIGVNLWPRLSPRRYLLCPRSMFCEFLPEASLEEEHAEVLLMGEVQQGRSYELVVTNASGLYRYRLGDVVKVVGFHNQCPVVEFQYRRGQMLSVRGEKISELLFLEALKNAVALWSGAQLVDYCCAESGILGDTTGGSDPHYQVFVELKGLRNLTEEQRYKLDHCLQQVSAVYRSFRIKGSIGPMRVQLVADGAFHELQKQMMDFSGTSPNTFKMQRVLRRKEYAHFLLGRTVS